MDLRVASIDQIRAALDCFYFLDPFTNSRTSVFLVLSSSACEYLIPNNVGRAHSPTETVIPELEVWYPRRLPLHAVERVIRVPIKRPGKWAHLNLPFLKEMLREQKARAAELREQAGETQGRGA